MKSVKFDTEKTNLPLLFVMLPNSSYWLKKKKKNTEPASKYQPICDNEELLLSLCISADDPRNPVSVINLITLVAASQNGMDAIYLCHQPTSQLHTLILTREIESEKE